MGTDRERVLHGTQIGRRVRQGPVQLRAYLRFSVSTSSHRGQGGIISLGFTMENTCKLAWVNEALARNIASDVK